MNYVMRSRPLKKSVAMVRLGMIPSRGSRSGCSLGGKVGVDDIRVIENVGNSLPLW